MFTKLLTPDLETYKSTCFITLFRALNETVLAVLKNCMSASIPKCFGLLLYFMFVTVDKDVEIKLMYSLDLRTLLPIWLIKTVNWAQQACMVCVCSLEADYTPRPLSVDASLFMIKYGNHCAVNLLFTPRY